MISMLRKIYPLILMFFSLTFLSACGYVDYFFLKPPQDTAQELLEAGNMAMDSQDYGQAIKYYSKLKEKYPFSPYTTQAELSLADAYFMDEKYLAAENAYKEFESFHPGDKNIPYVLFQIGMSNLKQFKSIDLPQKNVQESLQYFNRLKQSYPDSSYAKKVDPYIKKGRRYIAEHEIFVADFYWRREEYLAAWKRYSYVQKHFKDCPDILSYAQKRSRMAYFKYQQTSSEKERTSQKGSWKEWFDWL